MPNLNLPKEATFKGPAILWKRALAFVIDLIILDFVIGTPLRSIITRLIPSENFSASYSYLNTNPQIISLLSIIFLFYGLLALLYFSILEYNAGQTIGKIFMNIKVESSVDQMTFLSIIIRNMMFIMMFPFILLWLIDPIFIIFNKDGRRLSEILSKTKTVEIYRLR